MKLRNMIVSSVVLMVSTFAAYAQTIEIHGGVTKVDLAASFVSALSSLHVAPAPIGASELKGTTIDFPILIGQLDVSDSKAEAIHSGGLSLTAEGTVVQLRDFIIDTTGAKPIITGLVILNGNVVGRITLFDLAINNVNVEQRNDDLVLIKNVSVTLDSTAASTLNSVFKISALTGGLSVGTAKILIVHN